MASRQQQGDGGRVLADLIESQGWRITTLARRSGVSEGLIRKYVKGVAKRPQVEHVARIARTFGSEKGPKILYAFGFDDPARELAAANLPAKSPVPPIEEIPHPEALSLDERLTRFEERIEEELREIRELVRSGNAKPGFHAGPAPVTDINEWGRRPIPAQAVGF